MNAQVRNFRAEFRAKLDISHPDTLQAARNPDTLAVGTQPRALWYLRPSIILNTAPDTLRECLAPRGM
eukprot:COSAG02_NODE_1128_length_14425_cov_18.666271_8_plen_68_part_00